MMIDLGIVTQTPFLALPRQRRGRPRIVGLIAVLMVLGALLALGGSGGAPTSLRRVTIAAPAGLVIGADEQHVLVLSTRDQPRLYGFRVSDGQQDLVVPLATSGAVWTASVVSGVVLLTGQAAPGRPIVEAVAPGSGNVLWQREGELAQAVAGGSSVLLRRPASAAGAGGSNPTRDPIYGFGAVLAQQWDSVDVHSGRVLWHLDLEQGARTWPTTVDGTRLLVTVAAAGAVEVHNLDSGLLVRAGMLAAPAGDLDVLPGLGLLVLHTPTAMTAYGLADLRRRWTAPIDARAGSVHECGSGVCLATGARPGVRMVDAATGRTRWDDARWSTVKVEAGKLVATTEDGPQDVPTVIIDQATGLGVASLGRWQQTYTDPVGESLALHRLPNGQALLAVIDAGPGIHILGTVTEDVRSCALMQHYLTCRDGQSGAIHLWIPARN